MSGRFIPLVSVIHSSCDARIFGQSSGELQALTSSVAVPANVTPAGSVIVWSGPAFTCGAVV